MTASVLDVSKYILKETGEVSAMKLQKLAYYSQAWHMVWEEAALFPEDFQAWANGPVCPLLYDRHRGMFLVDKSIVDDARIKNVSSKAKENISKVLSFYGDKSAFWLSNVSHQEAPWRNARRGLPAGESSNEVIKKGDMFEYYGSL